MENCDMRKSDQLRRQVCSNKGLLFGSVTATLSVLVLAVTSPVEESQWLLARASASTPAALDNRVADDLGAAPPLLKPFPGNRIRDFYFRQAEDALLSDEPIPPLLPQFPGLDGGAFGHWGQNPEEANYDRTLNSVDTGNVICQLVSHFGATTSKGVSVQLDRESALSAVFDPEQMTFRDLWQGGFVRWGEGRFGVMGGVSAVGRRVLDLTESQWQGIDGNDSRYVGFTRNGQVIVFHYQLGAAQILDSLTVQKGIVFRSLKITEQLPAGARLMLLKSDVAIGDVTRSNGIAVVQIGNATDGLTVSCREVEGGPRLLTDDRSMSIAFDSAVADHGTPSTVHVAFQLSKPANSAAQVKPQDIAPPGDPAQLAKPGSGQWTRKTVMTTGHLGTNEHAFAIDTITVPFAQQNPFGTPMRLCGIGSFSDGRLVVSTLLGDIWVIDGVDSDLSELTWQRMAAGFYQPLGLLVQDDHVIVLGRDQVTRLHDLNADGEADFYECVTNNYPTSGGHDFCTSLQQDAAGRLYWFTASQDFGVTRYESGGRPESLANGLRNSNGIGVSADGRTVLATVQEGTWTPASAIFEVGGHSYHGLHGPREGHGAYGYELPLCFIPRGIDHSSGEIAFLPEDTRLGPLAKAVIGTSFGNCSHYLILRDPLVRRNGSEAAVNGGIVPLPGEFRSGACRLHSNARDGALYVVGTEGWQSYASEKGSLQRLRYTGQSMPLPVEFETRSNGIILRFNTSIDPASVTRDHVFCQQWNYLYSAGYGSPEYSVKEPGRQGHDYVPVRSVHLLSDRRSVFVEIPELHPVMQFHVHLQLRDAQGKTFTPDAYLSLLELGAEFTEFPDRLVKAKRPAPPFPIAEKYEQDPRLIAQDQLGTNFGWVQQAVKLSISAAPGLQFEPRRLRVAPGAKVAMTFRNADPGMPHNVVIVKADQLNSFGERSMMLASNPRAIATHYVPEDPAEICFSPILPPNDQYTVFFEAPVAEGEYKLLCTYPGHWRVMQGSLFVLPDDQPLPEPTDEELSRRFVRSWTLEDLQDDADLLTGRAYEKGKAVFAQAGCSKCHRVRDDGSPLGPELTQIADRFRGTRLLQHVLEPSFEINKQFQTWVAVMTDGRAIAGLLTEQNTDTITMLPNPLRPESRVVLNRSDIEELAASPLSTMPAGLLMVFERDEILDLLAYIQSGGDPGHALYRR